MPVPLCVHICVWEGAVACFSVYVKVFRVNQRRVRNAPLNCVEMLSVYAYKDGKPVAKVRVSVHSSVEDSFSALLPHPFLFATPCSANHRLRESKLQLMGACLSVVSLVREESFQCDTPAQTSPLGSKRKTEGKFKYMRQTRRSFCCSIFCSLTLIKNMDTDWHCNHSLTRSN